jgi:ferredoxin-2, mitochondrial
MVKVTFITADGARITAEGAPGLPLLEVAQAAEGQMACSTCHVVIARDWFDRLPPASEDEEDMLDLAAGVTRTSRLSCQIELAPELDGLEVRIPGEARDMQRR